ncbi:MAG: response regulator [Deltaproteobacteria bacterium]|nr:response regulator [Deltaproteobacteria bacterium]
MIKTERQAMESHPRKISYLKSLAGTLTITFSVLILVALIIASSLQMYFSFKSQQKVLVTNQNLIAKNAANTVENFIDEKFTILETVSKRRDLITLNSGEQRAGLDRLMGLEPAFRQLTLLNPQETEIARVSKTSTPISFRLMNLDKEELLNRVGSKERYIGPVYIDKVTSEPMMIMAVSVTDVFDDYKGILVAETNLKFMWDLMGQIRIGENGHAYVVEKQGYLIAYRDISRVLKRENLSHLKEVNLFVKEKADNRKISTGVSKGILGTYVVTTQVPLKNPDWSVIVELPVMEAYHPIIMTLILSGLAMLLSIIIAVISGVYLSRRLTKPVIELRDAAEKIGKGQLTLAIDISARNEIGDLAASFNKMVIDLQNTTVSKNALIAEINERKQVEKILMESEQKMKAILMASPIGIGLVNIGKLEWANDTLFNIAGYEKEFLLGQDITILCPDEAECMRVEKTLFSGITGSKTGNIETQWKRENGALIDCILGSCPLDSADPSKGQIITVIDVSESKELQSKLIRAQKMEVLGTLAAGVAHDLNNILGGIVSYPELLIMNMTDDNPMKPPLLTIKKAGDRAAAIVQDLLTLARRGVTISEIINLNEIIFDFLESPEYETILSFHPDVKVETDLDETLLNIMGSKVNFSKVIMNLVSNAAEAMPNGGNIKIKTENHYLEQPVSAYELIDKGEYVTLTVSDTGEGISKSDLVKIFEPFYTKKKMGRSGTGLGMTVVWGTVKDHNGYIDIKSEEKKGTTFEIYLPASRKEITDKKSSVPVDAYMAKGESILVVDDVEEQRIILSQILNKLGYKVNAVASGEQAVDYMKGHSVDLLVLDMIMDPGINGLETYKRILELHPDQKAIIASGFSETDHIKETLRLGAGAYLKKPYTFEKIGRAVRDELERQ